MELVHFYNIALLFKYIIHGWSANSIGYDLNPVN